MRASADDDVPVLHRDDDFLVLLKPTGLPTTSPRPERTLTSVAHSLDPSAPRLHPSSRLDAEVTGVVIFARTPRATEHLLAARRAGTYRRGYIAIASARPDPSEGTWAAAIGLDPRDPRKRVAVPNERAGARSALSHFRTLRVLERGAVLWLEPQTGRTHQLRVHAAHAAAPLFGDRHYGGPMRVVLGDGSVLRAARTMLHCARVEIPSPSKGASFRFEAPIAPDFHALLAALGAPDLLLP